MPACRQMSLTGTPASACLRIETIWVSVKRDFFMEPPGWGKHARKLYLWGVCRSGKLTVGTSVGALLGQPTPTGNRRPATKRHARAGPEDSAATGTGEPPPTCQAKDGQRSAGLAPRAGRSRITAPTQPHDAQGPQQCGPCAHACTIRK